MYLKAFFLSFFFFFIQHQIGVECSGEKLYLAGILALLSHSELYQKTDSSNYGAMETSDKVRVWQR